MGDTSDERSDRAREPTERSEDRKERKSGVYLVASVVSGTLRLLSAHS